MCFARSSSIYRSLKYFVEFETLLLRNALNVAMPLSTLSAVDDNVNMLLGETLYFSILCG